MRALIWSQWFLKCLLDYGVLSIVLDKWALVNALIRVRFRKLAQLLVCLPLADDNLGANGVLNRSLRSSDWLMALPNGQILALSLRSKIIICWAVSGGVLRWDLRQIELSSSPQISHILRWHFLQVLARYIFHHLWLPAISRGPFCDVDQRLWLLYKQCVASKIEWQISAVLLTFISSD